MFLLLVVCTSVFLPSFPSFPSLLSLTHPSPSFSCFLLFLLDLSLIVKVAEAPDGSLMGYLLGKAEGDGELWHGHVSAVTVAPQYRRLGLAKTLMDDLETKCVQVYNAYFVDLFVRASNQLAIGM